MDFRDSLVVGRTGTGHRGQGGGRHGSTGSYIFKNGPLETARLLPFVDSGLQESWTLVGHRVTVRSGGRPARGAGAVR